jgi:hypothetical protein
MERKPQDNEVELVELGTVSLDTQGRPGPAWEINAPDELHGIQDR